jgi:phosphorylase kinase alpha/beta subunit
VIQVVLIAESVLLQQTLATYGIQTQTPHQIEPIQIWSPNQLIKAYEQLGCNPKLGLTGRPPRPFGRLGTAKIYRACGYTFICYPLLFELSEFYLSQDMEFVIDDVRSDLTFLAKGWKLAGRPTFCMIIREENLRGPGARHIFDLLAEFKRGDCQGTKVRLSRLQEFISSACIEHLDFMELEDDVESIFQPFQEKDLGKQFRSLTDITSAGKIEQIESWHDSQEIQGKSTAELVELYNNQQDNMYFQAQLLQALLDQEGLYYRVNDETVEEKLEKLSHRAGARLVWAVVRFCSSLLGKLVDSLAPSITAILVRGKQVTISVWGKEEEVIDKPVTPGDIKTILYTQCFPYDISQSVLQQELIIDIGTFISNDPELFHGMLKIRIGWIVQAMKLELKYSSNSEVSLHTLSPSNIRKLLLRVVKRENSSQRYYSQDRTMIWNRQLDGALNRVPLDFYDRVWHILERTPAGIKVAGYHLPQQPTLSDMTQYELNFSLLVEQMLSKIIDPAYRQIIVESFMVVDGVLTRNPELSFQKPVDMDRVVKEAFDHFKSDRAKAGHPDDDMMSFYNTPPNQHNGTTIYILRAVMNSLLDGELSGVRDFQCAMC